MRQILIATLACASVDQLSSATDATMSEAVDGLSLTSRVSNLLRGKYPRQPEDKSLLSNHEPMSYESQQAPKTQAEHLKAFSQNNDALARFVYQSNSPTSFTPYGNMPRMSEWMPTPGPMFPQFFPGSFGEYAWFKPIEPAYIGAFPIYKSGSLPILAQVSAVGGEDLADAIIEEVALPEAEVRSIVEESEAAVPASEVETIEQPAAVVESIVEPLVVSSPSVPEQVIEEELVEHSPGAAESRIVPRTPSSHSLLLESLLQEKAAAEAALAKMQAQIAYYDLLAKQQAIRPAQPQPPMAMTYMQTDAVISDLLKDMFKPLGVPNQVGSPIIQF